MRGRLVHDLERQKKYEVYKDYMDKNIKANGSFAKLKRAENLKGSA